jgi:Sulfotransferase family
LHNLNLSHLAILYDGGRSGSVFFQSLLDSHSNVLMFPSTVLIGGATGQHIDTFFKENMSKDKDEFAELFVNTYSTAFDSSVDSTLTRLNKLGINQDQHLLVNGEKFIASFLKITQNISLFNYREVFESIHLAYHVAQGNDLHGNYLIVHALHTPEDKMLNYSKAFPDAQYIVCVRDPLKSHNSRFSHHIKRAYVIDKDIDFFKIPDNLKYPLMMTNDLLNALLKILQYAPLEHVHAVRNEDLHSSPEVTMKKVANFLNLNYETTLLKSTFGNLLHWGDDTQPPRNGFGLRTEENDSNLIESLNTFSKRDVSLFEDIINSRIEHFGYQRITLKRPLDFNRISRVTKWEFLMLEGFLQDSPIILKLIKRLVELPANLRSHLLNAFSFLILSRKRSIVRNWLINLEKRIRLIEDYLNDPKKETELEIKLI